MPDIKIDLEFQSLIPPLSSDECIELENSIKSYGCQNALIAWEGILIDGHHRYDICSRNNISFKVTELYLKDREEVKEWIIRNQFARRNLSAYQRSVLALKLEDIFKAKGKVNISHGGGDKKSEEYKSGCQNSDKAIFLVDTKKELSNIAGVSHDTIARVKKIEQSATDDIKTQLKSGEMSINEAYHKITDKPHISHNSGDSEWYTPEEYIISAREVMGDIDLDPASTSEANAIIKAKEHFTIENDGLTKKWCGNIWLNPPYSQPLISQFCEKFIAEIEAGNINNAIILVNNATDTAWFHLLFKHCSCFCFIKGRIKFWYPDKISTPLQGQVIIYFGNRQHAFCRIFSKHGFVVMSYV